jgi:TonB family protein
MKGKDKNIKTGLSGFLRYLGNKIPARERNSFEKELQKDPFAEEAVEGFSNITPDEIKNDLAILQKKLKSKTIRRDRFMFYRIAASVAIVIGISSLMIFLQRNRSENTVSENIKTAIPIEIPKGVALLDSKPEESKKIIIKQLKDSLRIQKEPAVTDEFAAIGEIAAEKMDVTAADKKAEGILNLHEKQVAENLNIAGAQPRAMAKATGEREELSGLIVIKGKIISSEDDLPVPGATINIKGTTIGTITDAGGNFHLSIPDNTNNQLVASFIGMESREFRPKHDTVLNITLNASSLALNEVVVVGYGVKRKSDQDLTGAVSTIMAENKDNTTAYTAPQPGNGRKDFDNYIRNNLRMPPGAVTGQKEVVVVSFVVLKTGDIDSIKIIRSPGKAFSDEAIRLIRQGPVWIPAEGNNTKIDEEVRIRIVFK